MSVLKERPRVIDHGGREWHVLAEWQGWLWLAPQAPDRLGPWTERTDEFTQPIVVKAEA